MLTITLTLLNACSTASDTSEKAHDKSPHTKMIPALLTQPSEQVTQKLTQTISQIVKRKVSLANNVFTKKNMLTLERKFDRRNQTHPIDGLIITRPQIHRLSLYLKEDTCLLKNEATKKVYILDTIKCKAL